MNKQEIFATFRYYAKNGRRLSIFGIKASDNLLDVYVFECDKKDIFSKKEAWRMLEDYTTKIDSEFKPKQFQIPIGEKPRYDFLEWVENTYCIPLTKSVTSYKTYYLTKEKIGEFIAKQIVETISKMPLDKLFGFGDINDN